MPERVGPREPATSSDCKTQSASDQHGHEVAPSTRRVWGGGMEWLLGVVARGGCYGHEVAPSTRRVWGGGMEWLLWVVAMGGCYGHEVAPSTRRVWGGIELEKCARDGPNLL